MSTDILDDATNYNGNKQNLYELPKTMTHANWTHSRNRTQLGLVQNSSVSFSRHDIQHE